MLKLDDKSNNLERKDMKVLVVGDVMGKVGRNVLKDFLDKKKNEYDCIIVNGENSAGGFGITSKIAEEFFSWGVDFITSGNHIWDKKEIYEYLDKEERLLRPLNYPKGVPGSGYHMLTCKTGEKVAVINLQGRVFMPDIDCPFRSTDEVINEIRKETKNIIVDFHAEASSEKLALGYYLDGKVSLVYGTHTHIQTADERILPAGTAYLTDAGMTGAHDSIIGMSVDTVLPKFLNALPSRFEVATGDPRMNGLELEIGQDGMAIDIRRINVSIEEMDFLI